jgi:hypothetical protein
VIDMLDTFYDESVALVERRRLLEGCIGHLQRLSRPAVVVASVRPPPPPQADPTGLLQMVQSAADLVFFQEPPTPVIQPRLF